MWLTGLSIAHSAAIQCDFPCVRASGRGPLRRRTLLVYSAHEVLPVWRCLFKVPKLWGSRFEAEANLCSAAMLFT